MKLLFIAPLAAGLLCFAQTPGDSLKKEGAPKEIEAALRANVDRFYQASVSGKFKQALLLVAEDSLDHFLEEGASKFDACETVNIRFAPDFKTAEVLEKCKGEVHFHGLDQHPSFPITSRWKIVDGQWLWYWVQPTEVMTPFGVSKITPNESAATAPQVPDGKKLASGIFDSVKLDRASVNLSTAHVSEDAIYVTNGLPGGISLSLQSTNQPGLRITADKTDLGAGEKVRIVFKYDVNDPAIACLDCLKKLRGPVPVELRIIPTGQIFPISINFVSGEN